jgi:hypothetical protein
METFPSAELEGPRQPLMRAASEVRAITWVLARMEAYRQSFYNSGLVKFQAARYLFFLRDSPDFSDPLNSRVWGKR